MIDSMTIALFVLALISFIFAISAIFWLSIVSKHLSALKAGKLTEAADKTASLESRITGCQNKADENRNQLAELQTRLNQVTAKLEIAEQTIDNCTAYIAKVSEKMASFELRIDEFGNNPNDKLNKLLKLETKVNDPVTELKSVEGWGAIIRLVLLGSLGT